MTRYTKLERRRAEFTTSNRDLRASASPSASPQPETKVARTDSVNTPAPPGPTNGGAQGKREPSEPAKLLKRAKLLRLKAKKAKDDSRRGELQQQVRELERQANILNGERGAAGKAGSDNGRATARQKRQNAATTSDVAATSANPWKAMEAERRKVSDARSEQRREKREAERVASQRCFACRQMGHSAKDCSSHLQGSADDEKTSGLTVVCCYRCGSSEHSLAKCKRSAPQVGPELPFASCFICSQKGHLASKCKLNQGRGIYPNGGCCKLCQSVDHLAKDCSLRTNAAGVNTVSNAALSLGDGTGKTGADEDDFHAFTRKRRQVDDDEKSKVPKRTRTGMAKKVVSF